MPSRRVSSGLRRALLAVVLPLLTGLAAAAGSDPYDIELWADALFNTDGTLQRVDIPDAGSQPPAFIERVKQQLARARVPPATDATGAPATLQTGIRLGYRITPASDNGQASVRMTGMEMAPRPIKRYAASSPADVPPDGIVQARVRCTVGVDGRCSDTRVVDATLGTVSLRRWAVASLEGWVFEPQRLNGKPVPAEVELTLRLELTDYQPKDFRDPHRL